MGGKTMVARDTFTKKGAGLLHVGEMKFDDEQFGRASMSLTLTEIRPERQSYTVRTETLSFEAESTTKKDAVKVGAGAAIGSVIGAIAGGGKGAAIGAAIGGGAGAGTVLPTRGKEVQFSAEDRLSFRLDDDLQIRIR